MREEILLDEGGVCFDKFHNKNIKRSVLLASEDSYALVRENDIDISSGKLGENILIDYNPYSLGINSKLRIGEVILEISQECTLCKSLSKINEKLPKLLEKDRGIFSKVIVGGRIKKGDKVYLLP